MISCQFLQICAKFYFKLERTIIKSIMFEPAHFMAQYLPSYFHSFLTLKSTSNSLRPKLSHLKNFLTTTLKLYHSIDQTIHLYSFLSINFCLQLHSPSSNSVSPTELTLLKIVMQSECGQKAEVTKLSCQILGFLFYLQVRCCKKSMCKEDEETLISKFVSICQKLRFQLEISKMSMNAFQDSYDEIVEQIFRACEEMKDNVIAKRIVKKIISHELFNVSDSTRTNIISAINQSTASIIFNKKIQAQNTTPKKQDTIAKTKQYPQKSIINEKLKIMLAQKTKEKSQRETQDAKKRLEEFTKIKKIKQIQKHSAGGKDRTIYHMRKSKFVPKQGYSLTRTTSYCQAFDYSTQMSSKSIQDYNRIQSQRYASQYSSQYGSEMDVESDDDMLVRETPRMEKRQQIMQMVSRKLHFCED